MILKQCLQKPPGDDSASCFTDIALQLNKEPDQVRVSFM